MIGQLHLRGCIIAILTLVPAGCAATRNTLAQDLAWERWEQCKSISGISLQRIESDGRIWIMHSLDHTASLQQWRDCDRAAMTTQGQRRGVGAAPQAIASQAPASTVATSATPLWKIGDEWGYRFESPSGSGTYVWVVDRIDRIDGVEHFVVKSGTREIFYRVADYASTHETVSGALVLRNTPPRLNVNWPLTIGKTWEQTIEVERPQARQTSTTTLVWEVVKSERVTVPAGTFETLQIVARNKKAGTPIFEMWVSADVKLFVKIKEWLSAGGIREREFIAFRLKP